MQPSCQELLPAHKEAVSVFHSDSEDPYLLSIARYFVEHAETVIWAATKLPGRSERSRYVLQWLAIPSLAVWRIAQLLRDGFTDEPVVLGLDRGDVLANLRSVEQAVGSTSSHRP